MDRKYARRLLARRCAEQGHRCCYCKLPFAEAGLHRATLEHRKAKMDGGRDNVGNLKAACFACNHNRGNQMNRDRQRKARLLAAPPATLATPPPPR
jgi:5-methylcytosine-specific restriction endonuclease McrA